MEQFTNLMVGLGMACAVISAIALLRLAKEVVWQQRQLRAVKEKRWELQKELKDSKSHSKQVHKDVLRRLESLLAEITHRLRLMDGACAVDRNYLRRDIMRLSGACDIYGELPVALTVAVGELETCITKRAYNATYEGAHLATWRAELEALRMYVWHLQGLRLGVNGTAHPLRTDQIRTVESGIRWMLGRIEQNNLPFLKGGRYLDRDLERYLNQLAEANAS